MDRVLFKVAASRLQKEAINTLIGETGLDESIHNDFPAETKCVHCGDQARVAIVAREDSKEKEYICDLYPNKMGEGGEFWLHDACSIAVYFCESCAEPTALYNQA